MHNIRNTIKRILIPLKNLWLFRKVVMRYRWWDFEFTLDIFIFSLEQQIKNWDKAHYIGSEFTKKRMIVLLKRLREFEEKRDELINECYARKLYSRDVLRIKINELTFRTWYSLGRNIKRFWD